MTVLKFLGILFLSIILTLIVSIFDAIMRNQLIGGVAGIPLRFSETALFGGGYTNYLYLLIDISFWFVFLLLLFKYLPILYKKIKN